MLACSDSAPWLEPRGLSLVTCSSLVQQCGSSHGSSYVWALCPRTCGFCEATCSAAIDESQTFLIDRVGSHQPFRSLAWWYSDVSKFGWRTHYGVGRRNTSFAKTALRPGGLYVSPHFAERGLMLQLHERMSRWRDGVEWTTTSINGARIRSVQSTMLPDACADLMRGGSGGGGGAPCSPDWAGGPTYALLRELLGRMIGHVNRHIEVVGSTLGERHEYQRGRGLHLTHWTVYEYVPGEAEGRHEVVPHVGGGHFGFDSARRARRLARPPAS